MNKCGCEVVITTTYKAKDGKTFRTKEECKAWNERTVVYIVSERRRAGSYYSKSIAGVFILKEDAESFARKDKDYEVDEEEITLPIAKVTVQQKITNKPQKTGWWNKFWSAMDGN